VSVHNSTLGVLEFQRQFIPHFAHIAKPLTTLLKKDQPFRWTQECTDALNRLIETITSDPVLHRPNHTKQFELEVDASQYAVGAILYQRNNEGTQHPVAYYSETLDEIQRGWEIYDRELYAIVAGLENWRHLLLGAEHDVLVYTDHANLQYYRHPHKINRRVARYIPQLAEYNYKLIHKPGALNKADHLSRRPDYNQGKDDNEDVTVLPDEVFAYAISLSSLEDRVFQAQEHNEGTLRAWQKLHPRIHEHDGHWYWDNLPIVVEDNDLRREVLTRYHDHPLAGHPGIFKTIQLIIRDYWWPDVKNFTKNYVQGCAICQATKSRTTRPKVPIYPITTRTESNPFETIAMDLITDLPLSNGFDSILTITDHDCTKMAIFLPCTKKVDALGVAQMFAKSVFPYYGAPRRVISDRDPRLVGKFATGLCDILGIEQNISTAYHPQTDGQSERTNQSLEQYLRIYTNYNQDNWADWLPTAQYMHNSWPNITTGKTPYELLMGHTPSLPNQPVTTTVPSLEDRQTTLKHVREQAQRSIRAAQNTVKRLGERKKGQRHYHPFKDGEKVWLEEKNIKTTHPTAKLANKHYGPFPISQVMSPVVFKLQLPKTWKIHNVFHASLLMPYKETEEHGANLEEPPPDIIDEQEEYEVKQVLDARICRKKLQYRIRWKGYSEAEDTWEPCDNVHAPDLVEEFTRKHPTKALKLGINTNNT
jgi:RNase H-like domain found in reverse transcriptase/Integrase zinc binding domain/Chromo (CHRromatin Organisation MOdifier) domain